MLKLLCLANRFPAKDFLQQQTACFPINLHHLFGLLGHHDSQHPAANIIGGIGIEQVHLRHRYNGCLGDLTKKLHHFRHRP